MSECVFSLVGVLDDVFGLVFLSLVGMFGGVQSSKTQPNGLAFPAEKKKKRRENMHAVRHILVSYCIIVHRYTNLTCRSVMSW